MLEKEPRARYADAAVLAEALEAVLAQADAAWDVPLFAQAPRHSAAPPPPSPPREAAPLTLPSPAPVPEVARPAPRAGPGGGPWTWLLLVVLAAGILRLLPGGSEAPAPRPMPEDTSGRELAPAKTTGDVGSVAAPAKSTPPAPVAHATPTEDAPVLQNKNKKKTGSVLKATTAALCVAGSACATAPQPTPLERTSKTRLAPYAPCPPGYAEGHARLGLKLGDAEQIRILPDQGTHLFTVSPGPIRAMILDDLGQLSRDSLLLGEALFHGEYVDIRFTEAQLPGGERVTVCMELLDDDGAGTRMHPGSTSKKAVIAGGLWAIAKSRF